VCGPAAGATPLLSYATPPRQARSMAGPGPWSPEAPPPT